MAHSRAKGNGLVLSELLASAANGSAHLHSLRRSLPEECIGDWWVVHDVLMHEKHVLRRRFGNDPNVPRDFRGTQRAAGRLRGLDAVGIDPGRRRTRHGEAIEVGPVKLDALLHDAHLAHAHTLLAPRPLPVVGPRLEPNLLTGAVSAPEGE